MYQYPSPFETEVEITDFESEHSKSLPPDSPMKSGGVCYKLKVTKKLKKEKDKICVVCGHVHTGWCQG